MLTLKPLGPQTPIVWENLRITFKAKELFFIYLLKTSANPNKNIKRIIEKLCRLNILLISFFI